MGIAVAVDTSNQTIVLQPVTDLVLSAPPVASVSSRTSINDLIDEDVKHANFILKQLQVGWRHASETDEVCKLALTTMKVLTERRNLLNMPLGHSRPAAYLSGGGAQSAGFFRPAEELDA